jgi:hypothetical protein
MLSNALSGTCMSGVDRSMLMLKHYACACTCKPMLGSAASCHLVEQRYLLTCTADNFQRLSLLWPLLPACCRQLPVLAL